MPYLHWDTVHKLELRNRCIRIATEGKAAPPRAPSEILSQYSDETVEENDRNRTALKNSQADDPSTVFNRSTLEMDSYRELFTVDELLLLSYLNVQSYIQPRRTLDHSRYHTLQGRDIEIRDMDQVVYRHTKRLGLKPRLMMVDQLWLWIIDNGESSSPVYP